MNYMGEFIAHGSQGRNAQEPDDGDVGSDRKYWIEGMESDAGGKIEIRVGMMDSVNAPE